jgi:hypothetical protein
MSSIPFKIPSDYAADIAFGKIIRTGTLLKDAGTGRIIAHVQETGLAQQLIGEAFKAPFAPVTGLTSIASNMQLVQLKAMVEGLQILQFANLGATLAGIGISAVGFTIINKKLASIDHSLEELANRMEEQFQQIRESQMRARLSRIRGLFDQADQAFDLKNPEIEWHRLAGLLAEESAYFRGEVAHLLTVPVFDLLLLDTLTRSYALCNSSRIECLVLARELKSARRVSEDISRDYNRLFDDMSPIHMARNSAYAIQSDEISHQVILQKELASMRERVSFMREVQDAAASTPHLIDTLIEQRVDGLEYVQALRQEKLRPILLIAA